MTRILTLMQGKQSNELFTWKGGDPSSPYPLPAPPPPKQVARQERVFLSWGVGQRDR